MAGFRARAFCSHVRAAVAGFAAVAGSVGAPASASELVPPEVLSAAMPGAVLGVWPIDVARPGMKAFRVLYRSTDFTDVPVAITGAVLVPDAPDGASPRDVVAWGHPTTGVVPKCAPTQLPYLVELIQGADEMVKRGYVVVATDYVGLGTQGTHPYLVGTSASRALLDSVRAARQLEGTNAGNRFALWGHSEGGHAVLFAGSQASQYAPELELVGVAASAPPTNLVELFSVEPSTDFGRQMRAMMVYSWAHVFNLRLDDMVETRAVADVEAAANACVSLSPPSIDPAFMKVKLVDFPPARTIMEGNSPRALPAGIPVLLAHGADDLLVPPDFSRAYMAKLCSEGALVKFNLLPGVDHVWIGNKSAPAAVDWMSARFAGEPPPNDC
jgi:acetyl esterase/lipase